jgi:C2H2-type zinc finger
MGMEKQEGEFKCDQCGATFKDADALLKHKKVHQGKKSEKNQEKEPLEQGLERPTGTGDLPQPGQVPLRS